MVSDPIIELQTGQTVRVSVEYDLKAKDLLVLTPERSIDCQELPLADAAYRLGQSVLVLGFSDVQGDEDTLTVATGHVMARRDTMSTGDFVLATVSNYGGSGGPVLNTQGEVVGMVGGGLAFRLDDEGDYIFDYSPVVWAVDVVTHLR